MCKIAHEVFSRYSLMDGFDCIREQTGMSTTTYCIPEGQLLSFIRDGDRFDCSCDALGSVRMVTDSTGAVVARFDFDAWGRELATSFDNVPGGMPFDFVGGLGVRTDAITGLHYMRARWYDSSVQRFISRDPIGLKGGGNAYCYGYNRPVDYVDPFGTRPRVDIVYGPDIISPNETGFENSNVDLRVHFNPSPGELQQIINECPDVLIINAHNWSRPDLGKDGMMFTQPGGGCNGPKVVYLNVGGMIDTCGKCRPRIILLNGCNTISRSQAGPRRDDTIITTTDLEDTGNTNMSILENFVDDLKAGKTVKQAVDSWNITQRDSQGTGLFLQGSESQTLRSR